MQRVRGLGSMDDGGPVAILRGLGALGVSMLDCARAFVARQKCKAGNVRSDGTTFWSYNQPIGRWIGKRTVAIDCRDFSKSTSKHQTRLQQVLYLLEDRGVRTTRRAIGERTIEAGERRRYLRRGPGY